MTPGLCGHGLHYGDCHTCPPLPDHITVLDDETERLADTVEESIEELLPNNDQ